MIDRYWSSKMREIWKGNTTKYAYWRKVEIAVLKAREGLGQIPAGTTAEIEERTWMDEHVARVIDVRDKRIGHDLNAFIEVMRAQTVCSRDTFSVIADIADEDDLEVITRALTRLTPLAGYFHDGMTSYDTEEPAMSLLLFKSCSIINDGLFDLSQALRDRAIAHRGQLMAGRTHGQQAQPITFGVKCLAWLDMVMRSDDALRECRKGIAVMKLSGAVGMYGTLGPEVEEGVAELLGLEPVIATQILSLDRRARLMNELALIASVLAKIAFDLWLMSQTEVGEIREPFRKHQKGSSAMPHKKNPITLEQVMGLAREVRAHAIAMMENVCTAHERDISHSSVERLAVVDAFGLLDHMITKLTWIITEMDVFPERMLANLELTHGTMASQRVEMLLKQLGMDAETAYRDVQHACGEAMQTNRHVREVLLSNLETGSYLKGHEAELDDCFDWAQWRKGEDAIYRRADVA